MSVNGRVRQIGVEPKGQFAAGRVSCQARITELDSSSGDGAGLDVGIQVANQEARLRSLYLTTPIAGNLQNPAQCRPPALQIFDFCDVDAPVVYWDLEVPGVPNALRVCVVCRQIQMRRSRRNLQLLNVDVLRPINGSGAQVIDRLVVEYGVREIQIHLALRVI